MCVSNRLFERALLPIRLWHRSLGLLEAAVSGVALTFGRSQLKGSVPELLLGGFDLVDERLKRLFERRRCLGSRFFVGLFLLYDEGWSKSLTDWSAASPSVERRLLSASAWTASSVWAPETSVFALSRAASAAFAASVASSMS